MRSYSVLIRQADQLSVNQSGLVCNQSMRRLILCVITVAQGQIAALSKRALHPLKAPLEDPLLKFVRRSRIAITARKRPRFSARKRTGFFGDMSRDRIHKGGRQSVIGRQSQIIQTVSDSIHARGLHPRLDHRRHKGRKLWFRPSGLIG